MEESLTCELQSMRDQVKRRIGVIIAPFFLVQNIPPLPSATFLFFMPNSGGAGVTPNFGCCGVGGGGGGVGRNQAEIGES
jgi:hypothetical protein